MNDDPTIKLDPRFDEVIGLLRTVLERQTELEAKVDARLHDTRPIWEQVLARLTSIEERQEKMEQRQESMDRRVRWIYDEFKELKVKLRPTFNDVTKLLNDRDDFEERILKLESERP